MSESIGEFEGTVEDSSSELWIERVLLKMPHLFDFAGETGSQQHVDNRDHMLHYLYNRVITEGGDDNHAALMAEISLRSYYDNVFNHTFPGLEEEDLETELKDYDCYRFLIDAFEANCGKFTDYGFKYAKYLRHTCVVGDAEMIGDTAETLSNFCNGTW